MTKCFNTLHKDVDQHYLECQKVEKLLKAIRCQDAKLLAAKVVIDQHFPRDFIGACGYFLQQVTRIHGPAQLEYKQSRHKKRGSNWSLLELTGKICKVNPFLESYQPISEIPVARCCTVWTDQHDSMEYLLVGDQMFWFGTLLPNSLINPNQIRSYGHAVNDDPFDLLRAFGIDSDNTFIPFDTTGTVIHFELRVPTEWEKTHLSIILITGGQWNPSEETLCPERHSRESIEMRTIKF
jgi:hypothetical protein